MKFGLFYEQQFPKPWAPGAEKKMYDETLTEIEIADKLGIDYLWVAEHHFLEEYSHLSAPELLLAAASQRTKTIRLGHGVMIMLPAYNHPVRCAERLATLDLLSNGRVEWGTGQSASAAELQGFNINLADKLEMWREATEQVANMLALSPYPGYNGRHFSMPARNLVPKVMQNPHPPIWMACTSKEAIKTAARLGIGALTFNFIQPEEAGTWIKEYYDIIKSEECMPIGHSVNANIAMVSGFSCHEDAEKARQIGTDGMQFFNYSLMHYYVFGEHYPGHTNIWNAYQFAKKTMVARSLEGVSAIGTPEQVRKYLRSVSDMGLDQLILIQQFGKNNHQDICSSMNTFCEKVLPEFKAEELARQEKKKIELQPYIDKALARKAVIAMKSPGAREVQPILALGGIGDLKMKKSS